MGLRIGRSADRIPWGEVGTIQAMSLQDNAPGLSRCSPVSGGVLFVVGQLRGGGLERQLRYLAPRFRSFGSQIVVWNFHEEDRYAKEFRVEGTPVHGFPREWSSTRKLMRLGQVVRRLRPRVVHSYSYFTNFPAFSSTWGTSSTPVGSIRSNFLDERRRAGQIFGRLSARWPRVQIANNQAAKGNAMSSPGFFRPRQIEVVRNGLDLQSFAPSVYTPIDPMILAVGSLIPDKRWDRLLEATATLKRRGLEFRVRLVGDGPLRERLTARARELDVADRVELPGERHDVPALLASASFLVHTSDREGCPNVVMEAMASGRAVVATDAGDVPFLVDDGVTGFVVRRGDDTSLADRIGDLIMDPERCRTMGKTGREKAERDFSIDQLVRATLAAYRAAGSKGFGLC